MDDDRLKNIEQKLEGHSKSLQVIQATLNKIAVQHEQITQLQRETAQLWTKLDEVCGPNGVLTKTTHFQASCPRAQIRWLWVIIVPQGLTTLAMAFALVRVALG